MSISFKNYCMFTDFEKVSMFFRNNYVPYLSNGHWAEATWEYTQGLYGLIL